MRGAENETISHIVSECKMFAQKNIKRDMTMYTGIFTGDYAINMAFKEHNSGTSMSQMELLMKKGTRFYGILQSSGIPRLNSTIIYCCYR